MQLNMMSVLASGTSVSLYRFISKTEESSLIFLN